MEERGNGGKRCRVQQVETERPQTPSGVGSWRKGEKFTPRTESHIYTCTYNNYTWTGMCSISHTSNVPVKKAENIIDANVALITCLMVDCEYS